MCDAANHVLIQRSPHLHISAQSKNAEKWAHLPARLFEGPTVSRAALSAKQQYGDTHKSLTRYTTRKTAAIEIRRAAALLARPRSQSSETDLVEGVVSVWPVSDELANHRVIVNTAHNSMS